MELDLQLVKKIAENTNIIYLVKNRYSLKHCKLGKEEKQYIIEKYRDDKKPFFTFNRLSYYQIVIFASQRGSIYDRLEFMRKEGDRTATFLNRRKQQSVAIRGINISQAMTGAFVEGLILGNYEFVQYKSVNKPNTLKAIRISSNGFTNKDLDELKAITEGVYHCRDMVNAPSHALQATEFAKRITGLCKPLGIKTEVLNKSQIASLKMAGLIAVNKGSCNDPSFTRLEWCPEGCKNQKPIILAGKGVVFDTGGLSLKPSSAMENMKSDMAGGAAVFAALYAIAKTKLPVYVIGLIPATDNQPGNNALAPGDIITMSNNVTVEVINTDAEGRLILADALIYASRFDPSLVIDMATLTGSATRAIGKYGIVAMETKAQKQMTLLKKAGDEVYERIAQLPFWNEYDKEIESDIADIRNIGKSINAGAITAGKFLSRFVSYPWIHLDIAGMAFMEKKESYLGSGASGVGVRLLYKFVKNIAHR